MQKNLSHLLSLEKSGDTEKAIQYLKKIKGTYEGDSSISDLNLRLIEERLRRKNSKNHLITNRGKNENITKEKAVNNLKWSAIITMWKRTDYLKEQIEAINQQSIPPLEIIIIINGSHISEAFIRNIVGGNIKIISSDINSLYSRWALAYIAEGEYISVFDDDIIPGKLWIANAIRACVQHNALVGPSGRIFSQEGKHGYYELVVPSSQWVDEQTIDCSDTDIFCDWVCNAYVFKREWVGYALSDLRHKDSFKTFDDIQLATSLYIHGGIKCVTPMQPKNNKKLHGSLKSKYGNDDHAIWKTNSDYHFSARKEYIELLIKNGYTPIYERDFVNKFHLIIPFGDREYLERCLLSIKAQDYHNYTCTLVDDCHDGTNSVETIKKIGFPENNLKYIMAKTRLHPLRAREIATDLLDATPADIIIHLDGDDWLPYPDTLSRINRVYRANKATATYGNSITICNHNTTDFTEFSHYGMSKRWNVMQDDPEANITPFRAIKQKEIKGDWRQAPWCAMHMRTFKYSKWLELNRETFFDDNGDYLKVATDAAIFIPILNSTKFEQVVFIPEYSYVYQNASNTIHAKKQIKIEDKKKALQAVKNASHQPTDKFTTSFLTGEIKKPNLKDAEIIYENNKKNASASKNHTTSKTQKSKKSAVVTIITPDYLADSILCLKSYIENIRSHCSPYVFIASDNTHNIKICSTLLKEIGIKTLCPTSLSYNKENSTSLSDKYSINSDEYRWGMKSVVLMELLQHGYDMALFLDPDTYTVSDITDIHLKLQDHAISVFPHFRDPDHEYLRKILYKDGFFNGGMLAATKNGIANLEKLYLRCLNEITKDPERSRWDDQKYFDLFILETEDVNVNMDRGIDYNPWNYEPFDGIVSPSQRSYLLQSGFFIRHWHVSTMMIKNSIDLKEKKYSIFRPVTATYLASLAYINIIIVRHIKNNQKRELNGIEKRFKRIIDNLFNISSSIHTNEMLEAFELSGNTDKNNHSKFINAWYHSISKFNLIDNFELFSKIISSLFKDEATQKISRLLLEKDLKYISDKALPLKVNNKNSHNLLEKLDTGEVIKNRIEGIINLKIKY